MALIVEDGSIKTGADSYISEADASTYLSDRYGAAEAFASMASGPEKDAILRRGATFLETVYLERWKGTRVSAAQELSWPRTGVETPDGFVFASDAVPGVAGYAQAEVARRIKAGTDPLTDLERGGNVARERVEGAVEVEYQERAPGNTVFPQIDGLLRPYLRNVGLMSEVVRA